MTDSIVCERILYELSNEFDQLIYVGSTKQSLSKRLTKHYYRANTGKQSLIAQHIRALGEDSCDFTITEIKTVNCTKLEIRKLEQEHLLTIPVELRLNQINAYTSKEEEKVKNAERCKKYYETHSQIVKDRSKAYYTANKTYCDERQKIYNLEHADKVKLMQHNKYENNAVYYKQKSRDNYARKRKEISDAKKLAIKNETPEQRESRLEIRRAKEALTRDATNQRRRENAAAKKLKVSNATQNNT